MMRGIQACKITKRFFLILRVNLSHLQLRGISLSQLQDTGIQVEVVGVPCDDTRCVIRGLVVLGKTNCPVMICQFPTFRFFWRLP